LSFIVGMSSLAIFRKSRIPRLLVSLLVHDVLASWCLKTIKAFRGVMHRNQSSKGLSALPTKLG